MTAHTYWLSRVTKAEFLLFLSFWEGLSQMERQVYVWSKISHHGPGWIGKQLNFSDVEDHWIGMCGNPRVYAPKSQQVQTILDSIREKWRSLVVRNAVEIEAAFLTMVCKMLGFDQRDMAMNFREERVQTQKARMEQFAINPSFPAGARAWIEDNPMLFVQELSPAPS